MLSMRSGNRPDPSQTTSRHHWLRDWLPLIGVVLAGIPAFFSTKKHLRKTWEKEEGERPAKADAYLRKLARKHDPAEVRGELISLGIGEKTAPLLARVNHEVYGSKISREQLAAIARHGHLYGINPLRVINTFSQNSPQSNNG